MRSALICTALSVCLWLSPGPVLAGQGDGAARVLVIDQSGAPVAGATVSTAAGDVVTGPDGIASVPARAGGPVTVKAEGFAESTTTLGTADNGMARVVLVPAGFKDAVTVTAARGDAQLETPAATSVVGSAAVLTSAAGALDDLLRYTPGFSLFRRSSSRIANPTTQGVTLRGVSGSGASRTLVLADGVPLNDPFGSWVYWNRVPQAAIDRVEVLRGDAGDLYGAEALGGVVQLLTFQPDPLPRVRAFLDGGSHGTAPRVAVRRRRPRRLVARSPRARRHDRRRATSWPRSTAARSTCPPTATTAPASSARLAQRDSAGGPTVRASRLPRGARQRHAAAGQRHRPGASTRRNVGGLPVAARGRRRSPAAARTTSRRSARWSADRDERAADHRADDAERLRARPAASGSRDLGAPLVPRSAASSTTRRHDGRRVPLLASTNVRVRAVPRRRRRADGGRIRARRASCSTDELDDRRPGRASTAGRATPLDPHAGRPQSETFFSPRVSLGWQGGGVGVHIRRLRVLPHADAERAAPRLPRRQRRQPTRTRCSSPERLTGVEGGDALHRAALVSAGRRPSTTRSTARSPTSP